MAVPVPTSSTTATTTSIDSTYSTLTTSMASINLSPTQSLLQMEGIPEVYFVQEVDKQFLCGLCPHVLRYPMQTTCGCRFCYGCINNYVSGNKSTTCPTCEEELEPEIVRDSFSRKRLDNSDVYCWNKEPGCPEKMKLKVINVHLQSCKYEKVPCVHKGQGCSAVILRGQLADHLQTECQLRQETCQFCGEEFPICDLEPHQEKCKVSVVRCPNECTPDGIHQDKIDRHLQVECPLQEVNCFFVGYGCKFRTLRKEMIYHKNSSAADHLQMMTRWLEDTRLKITETQHHVQEITNNSSILDSKIQELDAEISALQVTVKKPENLLRELQKLVAKHSDQMDQIETLLRQAAKNEEVVEMKKTMFKPLQEKQDQIDDRLKRLEQGQRVGGNGGGGNNGGAGGRQGGAQGGNGAVSNARVVSIENQLGMHAVRVAEHDLRFQILETADYEGVLLWKIKDFSRRKRDADNGKTLSLYSQPFYTSRYGYKMCARIYLNGDGMGKGTHISLFFVVMRGAYDALLPWAFRQKVTLMLLDQETGRRHLSDSFRPDPKSSSFQRPTSEMNIASGCPLFVNQNVLKDGTYVKDDVMFIKVIVDTADLYGP